ncbi:MAG: hypothetical protein ACE5GX_12960, partial [Thermoanaerobaculia bacterium]
VWVVSIFLVVEAYAQAEEALFKARHRGLSPSSPAVTKARWWPFRGNVLIYLPDEGKWLADC